MTDPPLHDVLEAALLQLLRSRAPEATVCPSEVARACAGDEAAWRALMPRVRAVASRLAEDGRVRITRGGAERAPGSLDGGPIRVGRGPRFDA